uniref:Uncharacterized protein n=1 Tax=uncultured Thiotrichaceae bacterium TaxID=298394 RepID=A0A6S6TAM1_9GAMM|nr:MAG: Unknown protein [uncultured Thiotrichaceae bacterium]
MKILLPALLALSTSWGYCDYSEPYAPIDGTRLKQLSGFIPQNWEAIALAEGDLNNDKKTDYALIVQKIDPRNIRSSGGMIATDINTNPRHLLLIFTVKEDDQQKLIRKRIYRKFVPTLDKTLPNMAEPVSYIGINEGIFEIKFKSEPQDDSWSKQDITYRFGYHEQSEQFRLTTYENHTVNKATAMFKKQSIDLVSGTQDSAFGSMSSPRHRRDSEIFKASKHWTLCDIKKPLVFRPN